MAIDIEKGNRYLRGIVQGFLNSPSVNSIRSLAGIMGVSYGTAQSLLNPSPAVRNLPDHKTLEAIASYRNQSVGELLLEIESECPREITSEERVRIAIANIYSLNEIEDINKVSIAAASHLDYVYKKEEATE